MLLHFKSHNLIDCLEFEKNYAFIVTRPQTLLDKVVNPAMAHFGALMLIEDLGFLPTRFSRAPKATISANA